MADAGQDELNKPTPELVDLLRYRVKARAWKEFSEEGQADFIWVCYNNAQCQQNPEGTFLQGWCNDDEMRKFDKDKGVDRRSAAVQAGDIFIMMTARWARKFMAVIAVSL